MNYQKIYNSLNERAKTRIPDPSKYYEKHHIVPRCMGGSDDPSNLVKLTADEHYIAHLCLVKMNLSNHKLIRAAVMMCCSTSNQKRSDNKMYKWLREKHQSVMKESQTGEGNSQYGSAWIFNPTSGIEKKVSKAKVEGLISQGWIKGRKTSRQYQCIICSTIFFNKFKKASCSRECYNYYVLKHRFDSFEGKEKEFLTLYKELKSMNKALKAMGYKGAVGQYYSWAKSVLEKNPAGRANSFTI
jgi:hypothetical protein